MLIKTGNENGNVAMRANSITKVALHLASALRCAKYRNIEYWMLEICLLSWLS